MMAKLFTPNHLIVLKAGIILNIKKKPIINDNALIRKRKGLPNWLILTSTIPLCIKHIKPNKKTHIITAESLKIPVILTFFIINPIKKKARLTRLNLYYKED